MKKYKVVLLDRANFDIAADKVDTSGGFVRFHASGELVASVNAANLLYLTVYGANATPTFHSAGAA